MLECVGGPKDGELIDVREGVRYVRVLIGAPSLGWAEENAPKPTNNRVAAGLYRRAVMEAVIDEVRVDSQEVLWWEGEDA